MYGGTMHDHGRWKQRLRRVFRRTSSDPQTSFEGSSGRSSPRVEDHLNSNLEAVGVEPAHIKSARELAQASGAAEATLLARLGVDPATGQTNSAAFYKTMVEPDRGNRVPSGQKVKSWLLNVPDEFEQGPLDKDPEEWSG